MNNNSESGCLFSSALLGIMILWYVFDNYGDKILSYTLWTILIFTSVLILIFLVDYLHTLFLVIWDKKIKEIVFSNDEIISKKIKNGKELLKIKYRGDEYYKFIEESKIFKK